MPAGGEASATALSCTCGETAVVDQANFRRRIASPDFLAPSRVSGTSLGPSRNGIAAMYHSSCRRPGQAMTETRSVSVTGPVRDSVRAARRTGRLVKP